MNKHVPFCLASIFAKISEAMTMTRFRPLTICLGLLLAFSQPSFAAKRLADTNGVAKSQSRAAESKASAMRPYSGAQYPSGRDDPYAPGVNWPGKW
jgi:hypothetical protein